MRASCPAVCDSVDWGHQAPLSLGFSRREYWSRLPFPPPGGLSTWGWTGISCASCIGGRFTEPPGDWPEPKDTCARGLLTGAASSSFPVSLVSGWRLMALCFLFQVPGDSEKQWKPALVVLTEKDLLIYDSMPRRKEAWLSPVHTYPLLATR